MPLVPTDKFLHLAIGLVVSLMAQDLGACSRDPSIGAGSTSSPGPHPAIAMDSFFKPDPTRMPSFAALFEKVSPSVVHIAASHTLPLPDAALSQNDQDVLKALARSLGTGFIIDEAGHVVTSASVVAEADAISVRLKNGRELEAKLLGMDEVSDIALLRILPKTAPALPLGHSARLRTGEWVAVVGMPFGLSHSITGGIVSSQEDGLGRHDAIDRLLTDAPVNPGMNGSPVVNLAGEVVGIAAVAGQDWEGLGEAIPIDEVRALIQALRQGNLPAGPWLGVAVQSIDPGLAASFGLKDTQGALISRVLPGSPAQRAGLRQGDVLRRFGGQAIDGPDALIRRVRRSSTGVEIPCEIIRDKQRVHKTMILVPTP